MQELTTIEKESNELINQANLYAVRNQETYNGAAILKKSLSVFKSKIKNFFDPIVNKTNEAYKEAKINRKSQVDPIESAELILRQKCKDYEDLKEKERLVLQEKENTRLKDEADQRVKDEDEFSKAQGLDETEAPEQEEPATPPAEVKVKPIFERQTGLGIQRKWQYRIVDETKIPREFLKLDLVKIGESVRRSKDKTEIAGVEAYYG